MLFHRLITIIKLLKLNSLFSMTNFVQKVYIHTETRTKNEKFKRKKKQQQLNTFHNSRRARCKDFQLGRCIESRSYISLERSYVVCCMLCPVYWNIMWFQDIKRNVFLFLFFCLFFYFFVASVACFSLFFFHVKRWRERCVWSHAL